MIIIINTKIKLTWSRPPWGCRRTPQPASGRARASWCACTRAGARGYTSPREPESSAAVRTVSTPTPVNRESIQFGNTAIPGLHSMIRGQFLIGSE